MFAAIVSVLALIIACFGLYAFVHIMMQEPAAVVKSGISLIDLQELAGIPVDLRQIYQKTVIDIIVPALNRSLAKTYADVLKKTTYAELEKESVTAATEFAKQIEGMVEPTREAFINYIETERFMRKIPGAVEAQLVKE